MILNEYFEYMNRTVIEWNLCDDVTLVTVDGKISYDTFEDAITQVVKEQQGLTIADKDE